MFKPSMFRQWQDMALFALVAECGSVTQAALKAGMAKSSLNLRISQLEQQLGLRLLNRTTRKISLTFAGERYLMPVSGPISLFNIYVIIRAGGFASPARLVSVPRCWRA